MNKILIGLNAILVVSVAFLFFKLNSKQDAVKQENIEQKSDEVSKEEVKTVKQVEQKGNTPTGKIAYVNIDRLNEESLEIADLVAESKRRKEAIEASVESLNMQYQKKVQEYQTSAKAGIAPPAEMQAKEKEIMGIEKEAQNKQMQMENLSLDINDKNAAFQKSVRDFLNKWNEGRFDFILSYSEAVPSMLVGNTSLEVTNEIIAELNKEYKSRTTKK